MFRTFAVPAVLMFMILAGCQSSGDSVGSRGGATFCDRLVRWVPIEGEEGAERAVTQAEICAKPAGDGVWIKVSQAHNKLRGRTYWLLVPRNDTHLAKSQPGSNASSPGWVLQARPFIWAHEIVAVPESSGAGSKEVRLGTSCPRKAVGKSPEQRYCIAVP